MTYEPLSKTYYKNRSSYEQEYLTRFHSVSATQLDISIGTNPAFFIQTEEMTTLIYQILILDKRVATIRRLLPNVAIKQFYVKSLIEEVHQSLNIEQINSTRKEISTTYKEKKADRLLGMITKYDALFTQEPIPLQSCADIRQLYNDICLPEVILEDPKDAPDGELFRKQPVQVYSKTDRVIHTGLFPETAIIKSLDTSLSILQNEKINLVSRIAIFHYLFGYIHPFYNGNGRLARFISSYLLSRSLDPLIGVRLSYTINAEKAKYYALFKDANEEKNKGDLTVFILGFLEILLTSFTRLTDALESRMERLNIYSQTIDRIFDNEKHKKIAFLLTQVSLFASEGLALPDVVKNSEVGYPTVKDFLQNEHHQIMLVQKVDGKRKLYGFSLSFLDRQGE